MFKKKQFQSVGTRFVPLSFALLNFILAAAMILAPSGTLDASSYINLTLNSNPTSQMASCCSTPSTTLKSPPPPSPTRAGTGEAER